MITFDPALMFVTDPAIGGADAMEACVAAAIRGGATSIQLRDKHASDADLIVLSCRLAALTRPADVALIINDRVDVVRPGSADGLHIGAHDVPPAEARRRIGPDRLLGVSVTNLDEAGRVDAGIVSYIGVGPVYATPTKSDAAAPMGLDGMAAACRRVPLPSVAIGGINAANAQAVIASGADGIAVVSAIAFSGDPERATRVLRDAVSSGKAIRTGLGGG